MQATSFRWIVHWSDWVWNLSSLTTRRHCSVPTRWFFPEWAKHVHHGLPESLPHGPLIKELKQPVLGICLGMQLLCRHSEEGDADCLGIFDAEVKRFQSTNPEEKVPHMGWNTLSHLRSPLFQGMKEEEFVYFVHSFYIAGQQFYSGHNRLYHPFSAALHKDNFYATQFHPEKSGKVGECILRNFLNL